MLKYGGLFLVVVCLSALLGWLPERLLNPIRASELKLLYEISTMGPGGFDDAVHHHMVSNANRYSAPLLNLLRESQPGSIGEKVGLFFVEYVQGTPEIDKGLSTFAEQHPDPKVKEFVHKIFSSTASIKD